MIFDPLLKYAIEHEIVEQRLIDICKLPKTTWSSDDAHRYYLEFEHAADGGSGLAMCMCAQFCRAGRGVAVSGLTAIKWGRKACEKSFAPGCFEVGYCYEHGIGVETDLLKARTCFQEAAYAGYGYAATYLAAKYHDGKLGVRDIDQAINYAKLGHKHGDPTAPLLLAGWYENGEAVPRDAEKSVYWYKQASELGSFLASERLSSAYNHGELGLVANKETAEKYSAIFESQLPPINSRQQ